MDDKTSPLLQLYFYVPKSHADLVKQALFAIGVGKIGEYSQCCWQTSGQGQFCPSSQASPFIGKSNTLSQVDELKIEMICHQHLLAEAITVLKEAHPYEEVPYGVIALMMGE